MKKKIGLALGSGAVRGLAHIGILKSLEQNGIKPDFIAGTSMGAIIGGLYASGVSIKELEELTVHMGQKSYWKILAPGLSLTGFIDAHNVIKFLSLYVKDKNIEDFPIPFSAVATDFKTGCRHVFSQGSLFDAIRASSSIPIVFSPAVVKGTLYMDGGLTEPVPIRLVKEMGADIIIAVNVVPSPEYHKKSINLRKEIIHPNKQKIDLLDILPVKKLTKHFFHEEYNTEHEVLPNLIGISMQTRNIIEYTLIERNLESEHPDILIQPDDLGPIGWFEFEKAPEIIKSGFDATEAMIPMMREFTN